MDGFSAKELELSWRSYERAAARAYLRQPNSNPTSLTQPPANSIRRLAGGIAGTLDIGDETKVWRGDWKVGNATKGVISFLLLAFGIAWISWEIPIRLGVSPQNPLFQLVALPGGFAPAIAAVVVRRWITHEGFADAGLRPNLRKWRYYLVAWLLPPAVTACIVGLAAALGISQPDFGLKRALALLAPQNTGLPPVLPPYLWAVIPVQLMITALIATPILWGEEFGWRGYLQLRLLSHRPLLAALATGVIWGMWHFPLNVRGYNFPDRPLLGLIVFPISTTLVSIIFGWLRLRTGSIWASSLAHAATNVVGGSLTMLLFLGGPNLIFVSYLGILSWIPLGTLCAWIVLTGQLKPEPTSGQVSLDERNVDSEL
jgi:membrane protease YdiL (CAAX protease family)